MATNIGAALRQTVAARHKEVLATFTIHALRFDMEESARQGKESMQLPSKKHLVMPKWTYTDPRDASRRKLPLDLKSQYQLETEYQRRFQLRHQKIMSADSEDSNLEEAHNGIYCEGIYLDKWDANENATVKAGNRNIPLGRAVDECESEKAIVHRELECQALSDIEMDKYFNVFATVFEREGLDLERDSAGRVSVSWRRAGLPFAQRTS